MEKSKDLDSSMPHSETCEEDDESDVIIKRRLRDREQLRKRKAEALAKDSSQWVLRVHENQQQRGGRTAKRGRSSQVVERTTQTPETFTEPQLDLLKEAEPMHSKPELPEPVRQEQPPVLSMQNPASGMQSVAVGGEPTATNLDPAGEEEVRKPVKEELPEELNSPLENEQENKYNTYNLY